MVLILKCIKFVIRVASVLTFIFVFSTIFNGYVSRPRINQFHIWKVGFETFNFKQGNKLKYILIWSKGDTFWDCLGDKQHAFIKNDCPYANCYVTSNKNYLDNDYRNFDAILINGKTISSVKNATLPHKRSTNQLYIFANKESADEYVVCDEKYDDYFNLTWTYRLDSDARWTYFTVYDISGEEVGPKANMTWIKVYHPPDIGEIIFEKKYPVTWFVSNCYTNSRREIMYSDLKNELKTKYRLNSGVFGKCGTTKRCYVEEQGDCLTTIRKSYFYYAFENSFSKDYVTEKVLKALLQATVPIVFGGADYTRFLPPHSFIDAGTLGAKETAAKISFLLRNRTEYLEYFRWHNHYVFKPTRNSACGLCELLNRDVKKVYGNFREWWNPDYKRACTNSKKPKMNNNLRYLTLKK